MQSWISGKTTHQALTPNRGRFTSQINCQTVFEIGPRSLPWVASCTQFLVFLVGLLLFRFAGNKQIYQIAGIILAAFAAICFCLAAVVLVPAFVERKCQQFGCGGCRREFPSSA